MSHHLSIPEKLKLLRTQMQDHHIDAFIAMSADPHMSEYLPDYWKIRQWLTGFTGSVGTVVVTQNFAGVWVDGRYWVQAEQQLAGTGFQLQKLTTDTESTHLAWLSKHLTAHSSIAFDPKTMSVQQQLILEALAKQWQFILKDELDLINLNWLDRPALPQQTMTAMPDGINALSRQDKISILRQQLTQRHIDVHFISALDDIAWILNCRGSDVEYNPVFLSHLLISQDQIILFIDATKVPDSLRTQFQSERIQLLPYDEVSHFLAQLSDVKILLDPAKTAYANFKAINRSCEIELDINPSSLLKAQKLPQEITHVRQAMIKDGVALCHFFYWLEQTLEQGLTISELDIDEKITEFRTQQQGFIGLSFATIAGFNANGALPHYRATEEQYSLLQGQGLLLIDSGAQYVDGTTDITRVVPIGKPTAEQQRDYTLVLKAHIALAQLVYPDGIAAPHIDAIARQHLWHYQLDYRHGTGHGVGFALNVHEGPQAISYYAPQSAYNKLHAGMISSNEPGLYHEGRYGIRIENLVVSQPVKSGNPTYGQFLRFETLTLSPINMQLIDGSLLTKSEKEWLNQYHRMVCERLAPHLEGDVLQWLIHNTKAII